ncbi:MAG: PRC-barrel domain-containing protein [Candidatus Limnocylindrales bacterium]
MTAPHGPRTIHLADLVGAAVHDASGERVGGVVDIEVRPGEGWQAAALVIGNAAVFERFRLVQAARAEAPALAHEWLVSIGDVASFQDRRVRLREGARLLRPHAGDSSGTAGELAAGPDKPGNGE